MGGQGDGGCRMADVGFGVHVRCFPTSEIRHPKSEMRLWIRRASGAATVYFVLFTLVFAGLLVMATDIARLYLIQGELQAAADAAALAAASRLVGTTNSTLHAGDQVTASFDSTTGNDNRFNLRMNQIGAAGNLATTTDMDFFSILVDARANVNGGQSEGIDWGSGNYPKYVRVQVTAQAPVLFLPLLTRAFGSLPTVTAAAVAGISAPMCTACGIEGLAVVDQSGGADPINYGFVPGDFYTLYLTTSQQSPNTPTTPAPLAGTESAVEYVILNHIPNGLSDLDLDGTLFELGAAGISSSSGLEPPGSISVDTTEVGYVDLSGNTGAGTTVGRDILCGLNVRFGVDAAENVCGTVNSSEFAELAPLFIPDTDTNLSGDTNTLGFGLQDFATEYDGNLRRILTLAVIDSTDTLSVLNFRQFLIEMSANVTQGLDPNLASGAFRAQYIGTPVLLRCGGIGGMCSLSQGVGKVVLH